MADQQQNELDLKKVREVLQRLRPPIDFERYDTEFYEDSIGQPGLKLTFHVRDRVKVGRAELDELNRFMFEVTSALLQDGIASFPIPIWRKLREPRTRSP